LLSQFPNVNLLILYHNPFGSSIISGEGKESFCFEIIDVL
jgi:hypothetical protein